MSSTSLRNMSDLSRVVVEYHRNIVTRTRALDRLLRMGSKAQVPAAAAEGSIVGDPCADCCRWNLRVMRTNQIPSSELCWTMEQQLMRKGSTVHSAGYGYSAVA